MRSSYLIRLKPSLSVTRSMMEFITGVNTKSGRLILLDPI